MGNRDKIIAYDLGTSGIKASLYDAAGRQLADTLSTYDTVYTGKKFHEQDPMQWWEGIRTTTKALLEKSGVAAGEILALSISGHSLGAVPVSAEGEILVDRARGGRLFRERGLSQLVHVYRQRFSAGMLFRIQDHVVP